MEGTQESGKSSFLWFGKETNFSLYILLNYFFFHYIYILLLKTMLNLIGAMGVLRKVLINFLIEMLTYIQRCIQIRNVQLSKF